MMMSATALSFLVTAALLVTVLAPVILIVLFLRDSKRGQLW